MSTVTETSQLEIRTANIDDAQLLFDWRKDPVTQKNSINQNDFSFEQHLEWLKQSLKNTNRKILIFTKNDVNVGMGRADFDGSHYVLSWLIAPESRGQGLGKVLVSYLIKNFNPSLAYVKNNNIASLKIVKDLDFKKIYEENEVTTFAYS